MKIFKRETNTDLSWLPERCRTSGSTYTDLIEVTRGSRVCGECAKYHDRIYSISGKSKKYPPIPEYLKQHRYRDHGCLLYFFPYSEGINIFRSAPDPVKYSNRPFTDDRTKEEIQDYEEYIIGIETEKKDRKDYDWILEHLPSIAPKSFGGYRKMKNSQSANYNMLVAKAKEKGYII